MHAAVADAMRIAWAGHATLWAWAGLDGLCGFDSIPGQRSTCGCCARAGMLCRLCCLQQASAPGPSRKQHKRGAAKPYQPPQQGHWRISAPRKPCEHNRARCAAACQQRPLSCPCRSASRLACEGHLRQLPYSIALLVFLSELCRCHSTHVRWCVAQPIIACQLGSCKHNGSAERE